MRAQKVDDPLNNRWTVFNDDDSVRLDLQAPRSATTEAAVLALVPQVEADLANPPADPAVVRADTFRADAGRVDLLNRIRTATPAQIDSWLTANVTTLAQARAVMGSILKLIALDSRN